MFEGLDQAQLPGAIEAMLFVTDEPVGVIELADMLEADPKLVEQALVDLREKLERDPAAPEYILTKWGVGYYFKF